MQGPHCSVDLCVLFQIHLLVIVLVGRIRIEGVINKDSIQHQVQVELYTLIHAHRVLELMQFSGGEVMLGGSNV